MSRVMAVLEDSYPDLGRAFMLADAIVDGRNAALLPDVEVLQLLCASDDEAARLMAVLRAGFQDLRDALEDYQASQRAQAGALGIEIMAVLLRVAQLGCWLGQERLMSLREKDLRHRLEQITRAVKREAP